MNNLVGGIIEISIDSEVQSVKGSWTYNLGRDKREAVVGADRVHGFKAMPQVPTLEGVITDRGTLSLDALVNTRDATITVRLRNGKIIVFRDAWFTGDGNVTTEEGEIAVQFQAMSAQEA